MRKGDEGGGNQADPTWQLFNEHAREFQHCGTIKEVLTTLKN